MHTATPTATATEPADLVLEGYVTGSNPLHAMDATVSSANVSASACGAPAVETTTAEDGYYSLTLPGSDLTGCDTVTMEVRAVGYAPWTGDYPVEYLRLNPTVDLTISTIRRPLELAAIGDEVVNGRMGMTEPPPSRKTQGRRLVVLWIPHNPCARCLFVVQ